MSSFAITLLLVLAAIQAPILWMVWNGPLTAAGKFYFTAAFLFVFLEFTRKVRMTEEKK